MVGPLRASLVTVAILFLLYPTSYPRTNQRNHPNPGRPAMLNPAAFTAAVLDRILALLAPLFLSAVGGDAAAARDAANALLASYEPRTNRELRFAALAIAFSFGALDALSR